MNAPLFHRTALVALGLFACGAPAETAPRNTANLEASCPDLLPEARAALPIPEGWRTKLLRYAETEVRHSAWGLDHSRRNFVVSTELARREGLTVDEDVLFAAALLHDLGGLPGHAIDGVDHAERSAALAPTILLDRGFPAEKVDAVKEVILAHRYYGSTTPTSPEAIVFHDADLLDFLGAIGFARIASTTGRDARDLRAAVAMSKSVRAAVAPKLITATAQCNGATRAAFLDEFHRTLAMETIEEQFY